MRLVIDSDRREVKLYRKELTRINEVCGLMRMLAHYAPEDHVAAAAQKAAESLEAIVNCFSAPDEKNEAV